jgi:hypothetical protein
MQQITNSFPLDLPTPVRTASLSLVFPSHLSVGLHIFCINKMQGSLEVGFCLTLQTRCYQISK